MAGGVEEVSAGRVRVNDKAKDGNKRTTVVLAEAEKVAVGSASYKIDARVIIDPYEQVVCDAVTIHRHIVAGVIVGRAIARPHQKNRGAEICTGYREIQVTAKSAQRTSGQEGFVALRCAVGPVGARKTCRARQTEHSPNSIRTLIS